MPSFKRFFSVFFDFKQKPSKENLGGLGAHDWIRTSGLQSRSLSLYPAELRAQIYMRTAEAVVNLLNSSQTVVNDRIFSPCRSRKAR